MNTEIKKNRQDSVAPPADNNAYKGLSAPAIELPKGGGAIRTIDEKFSVNPSNGTSSFSYPLPFSSSRGMVPSVALNYSSGGGNGVFGMGWSISIPSIRRKTEKERPQYQDVNDSDTFVFSQAEDLVPILEQQGDKWVYAEKDNTAGTHTIRFYRPRIEGLFARTERWTSKEDGIVHWRVITKENITTVFGKAASAKVADPNNPSRIFEWLPEFEYNDKGYCTAYEYKTEDAKNIDASQLHERNRVNGLAPFTNTYLKRIRHGNLQMFTHAGDTVPAHFLFEVVFDYGDHNTATPPYAENGNWPYRADAFSDYHAGFEIRTCRRCERVLFYHNMDELPGGSVLIRSAAFTYADNGIDGFTFLTAITETGYIKTAAGTYTQKSTPPVSFEYQKHEWNFDIQQIIQDNLLHAPAGIDEQQYQWLDLYSEGLSGILTEQGQGLFYKSNLGGGKFSGASLINPKPSFTGWGQALQLQELDSNSEKQLVQLAKEPKGFFEYSEDGVWQNFTPFKQVPNIDFKNLNVKQLDLNGDGLADILISEDEVFTWYLSQGKKGYAGAMHQLRPQDEEKGPAIVFSDSTQSVLLADMNGDGVTDIARVRNGEICYWPNLGFGRFGAKVNMGNAPLFDTAEQFNPANIHLADIDGSGTPDIMYTGKNRCTIWINLQGNRFAEQPIIISPFLPLNNYTKVTMLDLLGTGVSCLVWNSTLPQHANAPLQYIDLMGSRKPHVMTAYRNNMGKEVFFEYKPSTFYYLQDKTVGTPWITKLPFPVQCVSKVTTYDRIRKTRFSSEYSYHHGYYDSFEREFRGFGRVEQTDAESIANFAKSSSGMANSVVENNLHQPPVLTKSWFHTGAFFNRSKILNQYAKEYFKNDVYAEYVMPEPHLNGLAGVDDWREALRACKGMLLRKEVYALDNPDGIGIPYIAEQHTAEIKLLQDKAINKHGIFLLHETEAITYHYERNPADPRIAHQFNIEIDGYGNQVRAAVAVYGRTGNDKSLSADDQAIQKKQYITCTWNSYTNDIIDLENDYRAPLLWQVRSFEVIGKTAAHLPYFTFAEIDDATNPAQGKNLDYHEKPSTGLERRVIEWERIKYRDDDGVTLLNYGALKSKALVHEHYKAAFTDTLLDNVLNTKTTAALLSPVFTSIAADGGGYIKEDDYYWIPSGIQDYDASAFYVSKKYTNPFGKSTTLEYDPYYLFITKKTDEVNNTTFIKKYSYRALQPLMLQDANKNISAVRYDELGMATAAFSVGKDTDNGDVFDDAATETSVNDQPGAVFTYSLNEWYNQSTAPGFDVNSFYKPKPNYAYSKQWEVHYKAMPARSTQFQQAYVYFDGSAKPLLTKAQAEPGPALQINTDGSVTAVDTTPNIRWAGNGRAILNNKGNAVKQYEPYFSIDAAFDDEKEMVELGVTQTLYYDPLDRQVKIVHPNGSFTSIAFTAWQQTASDENDNIKTGTWDGVMQAYLKTLPENTTPLKDRKQYRIDRHNTAFTNAKEHDSTPAVSHLDALGRVFITIADNKTGKLITHTVYDAEGNVKTVNDAMGRDVMQYDYDMLGDRVFQNSIDAGKRWMINDVKGQPLLAWDDRGFVFSYAYDDARRPVDAFVMEGGVKKKYGHIEYSEGVTDDIKNNLRGRPYKSYHQAGIDTNIAFDFKGNATGASKRFCQLYTETVKWDNPAMVVMESEEFISGASFDALNRPVSVITPHTATIPQSEILPGFNAAGLLETMSVKLRGAAMATEFVTNINYNAKRQREAIYYKNGTCTRYEYDPFTYALTALKATKSAGTIVLQDLVYTYDPVGNITTILDAAQKEITYSGEVTDPENQYIYDAVYRLTSATGRKHIGQNVLDKKGVSGNFRNHPFIPNPATPGPDEVDAFCNYIETYVYDAAGNMQSQTHRASAFAWTRTFEYGITAGDNKNNQLKKTTAGSDTFSYDYDEHGNMKNIEQLTAVTWNFKDQIAHANLGGGGDAWYVYDASGGRVRKVITDTSKRKQKERFYLGGFEIYREYALTGDVDLERESLHVMDDKRMVALIETQTIEKSAPVASPVILQRYQYDNHLGSASMELDDNGDLISYEEYYPFGTTSYQAVKGIKQAPPKRYRYTGKERDEESGLSYHGARYYIPWLCRWMSADPIGIGDGLNMYAYCKGNPISFKDPAGTKGVNASGNITYVNFSEEEEKDVAVTRRETRDESYRRKAPAAFAQYQRQHDAPKAIDKMAQSYFAFSGIALSFGLGLAGGATLLSTGVGAVGSYGGQKLATKLAEKYIPKGIDANTREFLVTLFGHAGGAIGSFGGGVIGNKLFPQKALNNPAGAPSGEFTVKSLPDPVIPAEPSVIVKGLPSKTSAPAVPKTSAPAKSTATPESSWEMDAVATDPIEAFRYGTDAKQSNANSWITPGKLNPEDFTAQGAFIKRLDNAVKYEWNEFNVVSEGVIPGGSRGRFGFTAPQAEGWLPGGGPQIRLDPATPWVPKKLTPITD